MFVTLTILFHFLPASGLAVSPQDTLSRDELKKKSEGSFHHLEKFVFALLIPDVLALENLFVQRTTATEILVVRIRDLFHEIRRNFHVVAQAAFLAELHVLFLFALEPPDDFLFENFHGFAIPFFLFFGAEVFNVLDFENVVAHFVQEMVKGVWADRFVDALVTNVFEINLFFFAHFFPFWFST